ncbi:MAG: NADH-quinone oxidoreductase subunit A [Candidatus Bathyarchaeota archaeon]|nr:NADH-quinone oxidoreductase subunit A [Candidatus Bathyarchaeota archaeon]
MIYIGDHLAFWIFASIEIGFLTFAIILAWLIGSKKPNKIKKTIYECGQRPFGDAKDYRILGITRYFGYAVVFFALDAFAWVVLTAAMSINFSFKAIAVVSVYILVVLVGIGYFLAELNKLVR